jgi:PA14 domain
MGPRTAGEATPGDEQRGQQRAPSTETDDGVGPYLNGQLIIDNGIDHSRTLDTRAPVTRAAGSGNDIRIEFYERDRGAVARLLWQAPNTSALATVPTMRLHP